MSKFLLMFQSLQTEPRPNWGRFRAIKISLFNGVIGDTRVDTRRLQGNWQTSTGKPITLTVERFDQVGNVAS